MAVDASLVAAERGGSERSDRRAIAIEFLRTILMDANQCFSALQDADAVRRAVAFSFLTTCLSFLRERFGLQHWRIARSILRRVVDEDDLRLLRAVVGQIGQRAYGDRSTSPTTRDGERSGVDVQFARLLKVWATHNPAFARKVPTSAAHAILDALGLRIPPGQLSQHAASRAVAHSSSFLGPRAHGATPVDVPERPGSASRPTVNFAKVLELALRKAITVGRNTSALSPQRVRVRLEEPGVARVSGARLCTSADGVSPAYVPQDVGFTEGLDGLFHRFANGTGTLNEDRLTQLLAHVAGGRGEGSNSGSGGSIGPVSVSEMRRRARNLLHNCCGGVVHRYNFATLVEHWNDPRFAMDNSAREASNGRSHATESGIGGGHSPLEARAARRGPTARHPSPGSPDSPQPGVRVDHHRATGSPRAAAVQMIHELLVKEVRQRAAHPPAWSTMGPPPLHPPLSIEEHTFLVAAMYHELLGTTDMLSSDLADLALTKPAGSLGASWASWPHALPRGDAHGVDRRKKWHALYNVVESVVKRNAAYFFGDPPPGVQGGLQTPRPTVPGAVGPGRHDGDAFLQFNDKGTRHLESQDPRSRGNRSGDDTTELCRSGSPWKVLAGSHASAPPALRGRPTTPRSSSRQALVSRPRDHTPQKGFRAAAENPASRTHSNPSGHRGHTPPGASTGVGGDIRNGELARGRVASPPRRFVSFLMPVESLVSSKVATPASLSPPREAPGPRRNFLGPPRVVDRSKSPRVISSVTYCSASGPAALPSVPLNAIPPGAEAMFSPFVAGERALETPQAGAAHPTHYYDKRNATRLFVALKEPSFTESSNPPFEGECTVLGTIHAAYPVSLCCWLCCEQPVDPGSTADSHRTPYQRHYGKDGKGVRMSTPAQPKAENVVVLPLDRWYQSKRISTFQLTRNAFVFVMRSSQLFEDFVYRLIVQASCSVTGESCLVQRTFQKNWGTSAEKNSQPTWKGPLPKPHAHKQLWPVDVLRDINDARARARHSGQPPSRTGSPHSTVHLDPADVLAMHSLDDGAVQQARTVSSYRSRSLDDSVDLESRRSSMQSMSPPLFHLALDKIPGHQRVPVQSAGRPRSQSPLGQRDATSRSLSSSFEQTQ